MNPELEIGGIKEDYNPNDFIGAGEPLNIPRNTNTNYFEYNQYTPGEKDIYKNFSWSCGLFANIGGISRLTGYDFTDTDKLEIQKLAIDSYGLEVPGGMYMSRAVDCVRNWWNNKYPDRKLISYKLTIGDNDFLKALEMNHGLIVGMKTSPEYAKEAAKGEIVSEDFPKGGGHLIHCISKDSIKYIQDNYKGIKIFNIYKNEKIIPLMKNWVYFPSAYLFLFDENNQAEVEKKKMETINKILGQIESNIRNIYKDTLKVDPNIKNIKVSSGNKIRIYKDLKAYGYDTKYIDYCIRIYFEMHITKEMEI